MITFDVFSIFPDMFTGPFSQSIVARAVRSGLAAWSVHNIREYTDDRHHTTDDIPYGGGGGMVMKPEPIVRAVEAAIPDLGNEGTEVILLSPRGEILTHSLARQLSNMRHIGIICGRYEGIDERVTQILHAREVSIGDYVLSGGELAAMVLIEVVTRMIPGVLGDPGATFEDSHSDGLLEYPQYTRPYEYRGLSVPEALLSGNHAQIIAWRRQQSLRRTLLCRPELLGYANLSKEDRAYLKQLRSELDEENN